MQVIIQTMKNKLEPLSPTRDHRSSPKALCSTLLCSVLAISLLTGCAGRNKAGGADGAELEGPQSTESIVYNNVQRSLRASNYTNAISHLETLEARFPFGRYAEQAQLELIFARYMSFDLSAAQSAARRFIRPVSYTHLTLPTKA